MTLAQHLEKANPTRKEQRLPEWMRRREEEKAQARKVYGTDLVANKAMDR
jgi:hypothetical protein